MQQIISQQQIVDALQNTFKFREFRPGQKQAISTLLEQGELLCIQPTGHGKSLLYQLPATLLPGITLVISPLLALVRDQLHHLNHRFGISAAAINTDQTPEENKHAERLAQNQGIKILFVAPEQLDNIQRFNFFLSLNISLIVVDEAHCISTWGHDFRPSYRQIITLVKTIKEKYPKTKVLGLTATANRKTEQDIKQQLSSSQHEVIVHRETMDRPNIQLSVLRASGEASKLATIENLLKEKLDGSGLIYCATRDNTFLVAEYLQKQNINAQPYHAGMLPETKRKLQQDFIDNKFKVIAATNALGMGIDKSDLRFIIHFDIPGSITAYYQEVGRCGRDGLPAHGILLFDNDDLRVQEYFISSSQPEVSDFESILSSIESNPEPNKLGTIKSNTGLHPTRVSVVVAELCEQGFIEKQAHGRSQVYCLTHKQGKPNLQRYENQLMVRHNELQAITNYAKQKSICLMSILRIALGDDSPADCGHCSQCQANPFKTIANFSSLEKIDSWLQTRVCTISAKRFYNTAEGIALLDSKIRSPEFVYFMRQRANSSEQNIGMSDFLVSLLLNEAKKLHQKYRFESIIPVPSRTWGARNRIAALIASELKIDMFPEQLQWINEPENRQGELLNNDQRSKNVSKRMGLNSKRLIPAGPVLLFDDYIGSGNTIKEAARSLRQKLRKDIAIVPFTIANVQWRLGKRGMV